jgi:hypothetical protein
MHILPVVDSETYGTHNSLPLKLDKEAVEGI